MLLPVSSFDDIVLRRTWNLVHLEDCSLRLDRIFKQDRLICLYVVSNIRIPSLPQSYYQ